LSGLIEPEPVLLHHVQLKEVPPAPNPLQPRLDDVVQGQIAACPIAAAMVAAAHARPSVITGVLGPPISETVLSKRASDEIFRYWSSTIYTVRFRHGAPVRVTPVLYFAGNDVHYAKTPQGPGWPSFIEKGYAIFRGGNSYNRLNIGTALHPVPDGGKVMDDLVGSPDMAHIAGGRFYAHGGGDQTLTDQLLQAMLARASRRPTIAGSIANGAEQFDSIVSNHAYAVLRFASGVVHLRNPWGDASATRTVSFQNFKRAFQAVWQAA
jgi:hypothetical protein